MQLSLQQLERHLSGQLARCYLICGDEPLLRQRAVTAVSQRASAAGFTEKLSITPEPGFDWAQLLGQAMQPSLFAEARQLHLELPGKIDDKVRAAFKALVSSPDLLLIVHGNRLDKRQQQSAWFRILTEHGVFIPIWPLRSHELPQWFAGQLQQVGLQATPDALQCLAELFEGNLLAASQQIEQLALVYRQQTITPQMIQAVAADSARLDVFQWLDALLAGDLSRALHALDSLRQEGTEPTLPLAVLGRELSKLQQLGPAPGRQQLEQLKIWSSRQQLVRQALTRLGPDQLARLTGQCAALDLSLKASQCLQPFLALEQLTLACCQPEQGVELWL